MRYILTLLFLFPIISTAEELSQSLLSDFEIGIYLGNAEVSEGSFDDSSFAGLYLEVPVTNHFSFYASHRNIDKFIVNEQSKVVVDYNEKIALGFGVFGNYNNNLSGYARINFISWELDSAFSGNKLASENDESIGFSLGVKYFLLKKLGVNIEFFSVQDVSDADINSLSIGLFLRF